MRLKRFNEDSENDKFKEHYDNLVTVSSIFDGDVKILYLPSVDWYFVKYYGKFICYKPDGELGLIDLLHIAHPSQTKDEAVDFFTKYVWQEKQKGNL